MADIKVFIDGVNGFLCEAGDPDELSVIISRIRIMAQEDLQRISYNAVMTARNLTDKKVAEVYLENLNKTISISA